LEANKNSLVKKASDLIKERDIIAQKLAERETEAARLAEELKAAEAAKAAEIASVKKSYEDLAGSLKSEIAAGEVKITELKGKLTVNMIDRILFDSGQAEVKSNGRTVLAKVGAILKGVSGKDIRIEGHTDNVPIGGELKTRYATNWELSTARATAVARYLQDVASIEPTRLGATGYGEFRPIAPNDTPENRALNRRIEIVLVAKD
jgi:chemotaxis protein MotB